MQHRYVVRRAIGVFAAVAFAGILTTTGNATAATTHASVPENAQTKVVRIVSGHSGLVRESFATYEAKAAAAGIQISSATTGMPKIASTNGCWYWNDWRKGKDIFGLTMWQFNVEPNWCGSGGWITSAYNDTWGNTPGPGWAYKGLTSSSNHYGVGWNVYENVRDGHFCLAEYFDCVDNSYPHVDVEVGAGGQIYKS